MTTQPFKTRDRLPGKPTVYVAVGLSRCGKSTWANTHRKMLNAAIVCGDDVRRALKTDTYDPALEATVRETVYLATKAMLLRGQNVIVEEVNLTSTKAARAQWREFNAEGLANVVWVVFPRPSIEEWQVRGKRAHFSWAIIEKQLRIWEKLDASEVENIVVIDGSK